MKMYDAIVKNVAISLKDVTFEILEVSKAEKVDTETGEIRRFIKFSIEVPRSCRDFARCRFTVKVPDAGEIPVTEEELSENAYYVKFRNLKVSYISNLKEVYFGAESFNIEADVENDSYS